MSAGSGYVPAAVPECPYEPRMTRAEALALRAAGALRENCHVVLITDTPVVGTVGNTSPTEIELHPTAPDAFGLEARVKTVFDDSAWSGTYDIDLGAAGSITTLTDAWGNTAKDVDADSATVHTQWPWHLGSATFRDNYAEDSVLPGLDTQVGTFSNNRVIGSTLNLTAKTAGTVVDNVLQSTNLTAGPTLNATRAQVHSGTHNLGDTGSTTLTDARLFSASLTRGAGATGGLSISRSELDNATVTQGAGSTGSITVTESQLVHSAALNVDPGSEKTMQILGSELLGYTVRTQDTGPTSLSLSRSNFYGKPNNGDSLLIKGAGGSGGSIANSTVDGFSLAGAGAGSIEADGSAQNFSIQNAVIQETRFTIGPGAAAFQTNASRFQFAFINALSPGRLTINHSDIGGLATVTHALAATGSMMLDNCRVQGSGALVSLTSGDRGLSLTNTEVNGSSQITQTSVNAASGTNLNSVRDCRVIDSGRIVLSDTAPAGLAACSVSGSTVKGSALGAGVDGVLAITGTSARVTVDSVDCRGVITLTDVPDGALSAGTSFHDLRVGPVSALTYTGGDNAAKQIRNITVEDASTLTITGLTGSAGVGLADVFGGRVKGQSVMTVTGARVAGQPVRNFTVEDGSTLNVNASGTVLQCQFRAGASLDTGAFRHSESVIEGAIAKTATAPNVNRLASKAFDDWL